MATKYRSDLNTKQICLYIKQNLKSNYTFYDEQ